MTIGDEVYSVSRFAAPDGLRGYIRLRIDRVTDKQVIAADDMGRLHRFWRKNGHQVNMGDLRTLRLEKPDPRHHKEDLR